MIVVDIATDGVARPLEICMIDVGEDLTELMCKTWLVELGSEEYLENVPERVRAMHNENGLWAECLESGRRRVDVEDEVKAFVRGCNDPVLVSDNPHYDRDFLPAGTFRWGIDVGTLDDVCWRFRKRRLPVGARTYRAEDDARACLKRLRYFRSHFLAPYGGG